MLEDFFAEGASGYEPLLDLPALHGAVAARRRAFVEALALEAGFTASDAQETVEGALLILARPKVRGERDAIASSSERKLEIRRVPWGTVVLILPHSAFIYLAATCLAHALAAGNRVVLRAPRGAVKSAALLRECLAAAGLEERAIVVEGSASELLSAFYGSPAPGMAHYFGSSARIPEMLSHAFLAGKHLLADGEGNTWVYIDRTASPVDAAKLLAKGATRYNGQTCTSVNGAIVHPDTAAQVQIELISALSQAVVGPIGADAAGAALETIKAAGGSILLGGEISGDSLRPTLIANPDPTSALVHAGIFAPAMWIAPGGVDDFRRLWLTNRYPLCAGVIAENVDVQAWASLPNLARLVVNGDPSVEDPFEPWGGYPATGNGQVCRWEDKYVRTVQVDRP